MKRLASRSTWWHTLPHKSTHAVNTAPYWRGSPKEGMPYLQKEA